MSILKDIHLTASEIAQVLEDESPVFFPGITYIVIFLIIVGAIILGFIKGEKNG